MIIEINGSKLYDFKTGKLVKRLPGLNDIITEAKHGKGRYQPYQSLKKYYSYIISTCIQKPVITYENPVKINISWYEPNSRRDIDNISSGGCKIILDTLVKNKILIDDSQKYLKELNNKFYVDTKNPRIIIEIEEIL